MSSARGNVKKSGPPKYQNRKAFKNDLHDKTRKIQVLNNLTVTCCCARCKDIIDWKIKYKKYKPLTVPKKCTKCQQKTIRRAYYMICEPCAVRDQVCSKCGEHKEFVNQPGLSEAEEASQHSQFLQEFKGLSERQRRTFARLQASGKVEEEDLQNNPEKDEDETGDISADEDEEGLGLQATAGTLDADSHQEDAGCSAGGLEAMEDAEEEGDETCGGGDEGGAREAVRTVENVDHVTTDMSDVKIAEQEHKDNSDKHNLTQDPKLGDKST